MNKKLLILGLLTGMLVSFAPTSHAQADFPISDVDTILEENALREAFTRYTSVMVFFQPEEATRLGFNAGNNRLNDRTLMTDNQTLQALEGLNNTLSQIDPKNLSDGKRIEFHLLQDSVQRQVWKLQQNRLVTDPLYYAQALDALYDLLLVSKNNPRQLRAELIGRLDALPTVYEQAKKNLAAVSPQLAQKAMEKAYYAYLSFDEIQNIVTNGGELTNDTRDTVKIENSLTKAKTSINGLFELFKELAKPSAFSLNVNSKSYTQKLNQYYQIDQKPTQVEALLNNRWDEAQHQLFAALRPFELSADEEEMVIVEDLNQRPQEKLQTKKDPATLPYTPPTANQFYAVAGQLVSPYTLDKLLEAFTQQANIQGANLLDRQAAPGAAAMHIEPLLPYFAYQHAFLTYPAFTTFWLRLPQGNELAKAEALNQQFNEPAVKLLISQEVTPGRYYQNLIQKSSVRRLFGSPLLANGWTLYALRIAQETNILLTDEELLFAAWQRFVRTASAVVDYRLHTQQYNYDQALAFLTEQNGFAPEQATKMLSAIVSNPGEAVSYTVGEMIWQENANKYLKKAKNPNEITAALLEMGNVSPQDVAPELKRLYRK